MDEFPNSENPNEFFVTKVKDNALCTFRELRTTTSVVEGSANDPGETETETITTVIVRKMAQKITS